MSEQKFDFQNIDLKLYLALRNICKDYLSLCEDAGGVMDSPPKEYVDAQLALAEFELSHGPLPNWAIARNWDYSLVAAAPAQTAAAPARDRHRRAARNPGKPAGCAVAAARPRRRAGLRHLLDPAFGKRRAGRGLTGAYAGCRARTPG